MIEIGGIGDVAVGWGWIAESSGVFRRVFGGSSLGSIQSELKLSWIGSWLEKKNEGKERNSVGVGASFIAPSHPFLSPAIPLASPQLGWLLFESSLQPPQSAVPLATDDSIILKFGNKSN